MTGVKRAAMTGACLALAMIIAAADLSAQSDDEFDKIFPYIGNWDTDVFNPTGQDRGNCGGRVGDYGEKLLNCSLPADQLPLNARGEAWLRYMDERQSPSGSECAQVAVPGVLGNGGQITAYPDRLVIQHPDTPWFVTRTIWMNGTGPTPLPGELFQQGLSFGHFDGNDLVIETTHFTFDPDGLDDHLHMASSVRKKVTERYQFIDEDNVRLIITVEDPVFLTRPFTFARLQTRTPEALRARWVTCDAETARSELEFAYPGNKYPEDEQ